MAAYIVAGLYPADTIGAAHALADAIFTVDGCIVAIEANAIRHYRLTRNGLSHTADLNDAGVVWFERKGYVLTDLGPSMIELIED